MTTTMKSKSTLARERFEARQAKARATMHSADCSCDLCTDFFRPLPEYVRSSGGDVVVDRPVAAAPTDKQIAFLAKLATERGVAALEVADRKAASAEIDRLLALPRATAVARVAAPEVPEGHYAIASKGSNDLLFVRVDHGTGSWAGTVFVKMIVGGHPDMNLAKSRVPGVLARILEDGVDVARRRYGNEIGRCCLCNRSLTSEWRKLGIGPECSKK